MTRRLAFVLYFAAALGAILIASVGILLAFAGYLFNSLADDGVATRLFTPLLTVTLPLVVAIVMLSMGMSTQRSSGARLGFRTVALLILLVMTVVIVRGYDIDLFDAGVVGYLGAACLLVSVLGSFGLVALGVRDQQTGPDGTGRTTAPGS